MELTRTKKLLLLLLTIIATLCLALCFTACDDKENDGSNNTGDQQSENNDDSGAAEHSHIWNDGVITLEATCTEKGIITYTCTTCGEIKTELIDAAGHTNADAVIENEVEATCTAAGSYDLVVYCSVCHEEVSRDTQTVEMLEHSYDDGVITTAPTCTSEGEITYTCTACNHTKTEVLEKTEHTKADPVVENYKIAACTQNGSYESVIYCTECNSEVSRTEIFVPATGHTPGTAVTENEVASTCTKEGSYDTVVYCTVCKAEISRTENIVEKLAHTYDGYEYNDTCHWQVCTVCGENTSTTEHTITDSKCTICDFSEELIYTLSDDKTYYIISGVSAKAADMTEVKIPEYYNGLPVTEIVASAFSENTSITSVIIADKVTTIGEKAFYGCTALKSVTIGKGVTIIGNYSFYNCTSLTEINYNAASASDLSVSNYAFYCAGQSGNGIILTVGASVKTIPAYIFYPFSSGTYSPKIISLQFADNGICTSINTYAFYGCNALTEITIPSKVTSIAAYAFGSCTALTKIYYNGSANEFSSNAFAFAGQSGEGITVTISASVTKIPGSMFYTSGTNYSPKIISVVFEENSKCTSIGSSAFGYCTSLQSINIPDTVNLIEGEVFYYCSSLTSVIIPNGVEVIELWMFCNCTSLLSVNIPDSVTTIRSGAFESCSSLTSITIPDGVISIGSEAFRDCSSLLSINIPDGVIEIYSNTFSGCYSLVKVTIGSGVMSIDSSAFWGCYKLVEIYNLSSLNIIAGSSDGFGNTLNVYTSTSGSSKLFSEGDYIFYNDSGVYYLMAYTGTDTSIVLPDTVNGNSYSVYKYAFYENTKIKSLTIGSGVTSIGEKAFYECTSLTELNFNATAMEDFSSESNIFGSINQYGNFITVINIGENVTKIPEGIFNYSSLLTNIIIPESVTIISERAFRGCISLISIYYKGTAEEWDKISITYSEITDYGATVYYYAENDGTTTAAGNYWYYDADGSIKTWTIDAE